jgi:hypothetical protein
MAGTSSGDVSCANKSGPGKITGCGSVRACTTAKAQMQMQIGATNVVARPCPLNRIAGQHLAPKISSLEYSFCHGAEVLIL